MLLPGADEPTCARTGCSTDKLFWYEVSLEEKSLDNRLSWIFTAGTNARPLFHPTDFVGTQLPGCRCFTGCRALLPFPFTRIFSSHKLWLWPVCPNSPELGVKELLGQSRSIHGQTALPGNAHCGHCSGVVIAEALWLL